MKYFTPDLLARFGSDDAAVATPAQEELEEASRAYAKHLKQIKGQLPTRFRKFQEKYYLHDARVVMAYPLTDLTEQTRLPWEGLIRNGNGERILRASLATLMVELNAPPKELLVLTYRFASVVGRAPTEPPADPVPFLEWQHDEVEVVERDDEILVRHEILFSNGFAFQIEFLDFDFAPLKSVPWASHDAERGLAHATRP
jgi:hypothetical protein